MPLQVFVFIRVKRGAVGMIDLMNKGLRLFNPSIGANIFRVGMIDLMNKGLRPGFRFKLWPFVFSSRND